ncbi:hypothetical protein EV175_005511, partial [Coemansia sp. RSA 1933]
LQQSPGLYADQQSVIDDDDLFNDDAESVSAKKRKKNKKKKKSKKKKNTAASNSATPTAPSATRASGGDGASVADDDYDAEDDVDEHDNDPSMMQNPFSSLKWADKLNELTDAEKRTRPSADNSDGQPVVAVVEEVPPVAENQPAEPEGSQEAAAAAAIPPTAPVAVPTAAVKTTRSRRGTNAARYVPGVGFVSDDGTHSTSPQLGSSSSTVFKASPPPNGVATSSAAAAASTRGSLGLQASGVRASAASNGRVSPMNAAARLATPTSRSQSPLAVGASVEKKAATPPLDKDALLALQDELVSGPADTVEQTLSGLAHDNLVSLAAAALAEKRRLADVAQKWQGSVTSVLQTYDSIAAQIELFRGLCDAHDSETARLSSLLAQAAQEAQSWHEQYDKLSAEVDLLRVAAAKSGDDDAKKPAGEAEKTMQDPSGAMSGGWSPMASQATAWPAAFAQQQQQMLFGSGGSAYDQFPGMPPHALAAAVAAATAAGGAGNATAASAMNHPLFAAASMATMDPASLMMLAGPSQMAMGMMPTTTGSVSTAASNAPLSAAPAVIPLPPNSQAQQQQQRIAGSQQ